MNQSEFERRYRELNAILPDNWADSWDADHILKVCMDRDRKSALEMWSKLVAQSPAKRIAKTYKNNLYNNNSFKSFLTELWCYHALNQWLCKDPQVLDLPGTQGLPDFECAHFDVDATLLKEAKEEYRVRRKLEDLMGDRPYLGTISLKSKFDIQATTGERWSDNESAVQEVLEKIDRDLHPDNPETIETEEFKIKFKQVDGKSFGIIIDWDDIRKINPDEEKKISERLHSKANQYRDGRPLIVFMDNKYTSISDPREVWNILIGNPTTYTYKANIEVSPKIKGISDEWNKYLKDTDAVPNSGGNKQCSSAIQPGGEGVFSDECLNYIAGVMFRMKNKDVCYIPNVYTDAIDTKSIYDRLNWGLESQKLTI